MQATPPGQLGPQFPTHNAPIGQPVPLPDDPGPGVAVNLGSLELVVRSASPSGSPGLPVAELTAIAQSITPTPDYPDLGAWYDAVTAIPAG